MRLIRLALRLCIYRHLSHSCPGSSNTGLNISVLSSAGRISISAGRVTVHVRAFFNTTHIIRILSWKTTCLTDTGGIVLPVALRVWRTLLTHLLAQHYGLTLSDTPFGEEDIQAHIEAGVPMAEALRCCR